MYKQCGICQQEKKLEEFSKNKSTKDGRSGHCKECRVAQIQAIRGVAPNKLVLAGGPDVDNVSSEKRKILDQLEKYHCRCWLTDGVTVWRWRNPTKYMLFEKFDWKFRDRYNKRAGKVLPRYEQLFVEGSNE